MLRSKSFESLKKLWGPIDDFLFDCYIEHPKAILALTLLCLWGAIYAGASVYFAILPFILIVIGCIGERIHDYYFGQYYKMSKIQKSFFNAFERSFYQYARISMFINAIFSAALFITYLII